MRGGKGSGIMAKATDLTKAQQAETALALPPELAGGMTVDGGDSAPTLGRLAMYQGTSTEQQMYGEGVFKRGDFIDVMERRKVASTRIIPVHAEVLYQCWPSGSKMPEYTYRANEKHKIPAGDLDWNGSEPPRATKVYSAVVLVEGESWPYLFNFKRTAAKAFENIAAFNARRSATGQGFGLFELYAEDATNGAGQVYKRLMVKPPVNVPESMVPLLKSVVESMAKVKARAAEMAADEGDYSPPDDGIPI